MNNSIVYKSFLSILIPLVLIFMANAQGKDFLISSPEILAELIINENEEAVVHTAVKLFSNDVYMVSGKRPKVKSMSRSNYLIKTGTLGVDNKFDKEAINAGINIHSLKLKWEAYVIKSVVNSNNKSNALWVVGSTPRGTAYGLMELSRMIGVSPWYWWADVRPERNEVLELPGNLFVEAAPDIKFRGIFLNDEGWGLWPWAKKTFDPEFGDIGPRTYEKIFELLLRLKANHVWPAMHPNTKSFQLVAENREMARRYGIVVGSSHAEPLLFNNAGSEWNSTHDGPWDYNRNKGRILEVLETRVRNAAQFENIYTMGLRGIHDSKMEGINYPEEGARVLERVLEDQRNILTKYIPKPANEIPQVFIPYKEVLEQYDAGLKVPDDITLMWANDNYGFIRRFSNEKEQQRKGRGGVYYHLSYLGAPHPYLWLSPTSPALVWREMTRARLHGMDQIWIANVGDLKRREWETEFFLDLAWDGQSWTADNLESYFEWVATRDISAKYAKEIGSLMWEYYRLATERKPEFMGFSESQWAGWTPVQDPMYSLWHYGDEVDKRIRTYQQLRTRAKEIFLKLPKKTHDTYFQLVYHPIAGATSMNEKWLYAFKSREYAKQGRSVANQYSDSAFYAFNEIIELTRRYNEDVSDGKWNLITDYKPGFRNGSSVFFEPITTRIVNDGVQGIGVIIEGQSKPLKPQNGSLPEITTRNSIIKMNSAEVKVFGEMVTVEDPHYGVYLTWPKDCENRIIPGPRWDTIPYAVVSPAKAVFDFYFDDEPGGEHTLYLSVDHLDNNSDSWWITFNDMAPIQTTEFIGRTERLRVTNVVLNPGWNRLTVHPREDGVKLYGVEFVQEGQRLKVDFADIKSLPKFNRFTKQSYFIDIYSFGETTEDWTATTSDAWIKLSKQNGSLCGADRIWVSIDYDDAPIGDDFVGYVEISGKEQSYRVEVAVLNQNFHVSSNAYIEDNGAIAMLASGYTHKRTGTVANWHSLVGLGRSGSAMLPEPMKGWYANDFEHVLWECPALEYEIVVLEGGTAQVIVEAVPAFPLNKPQSLRCAVSINDEEPQWISFDMGKDGSKTWQVNVLESRMVGKGELELSPGNYRFKLWGTDPSVNIDRILIVFGGLKPGYIGPNITQMPAK